MIAKFAVRPSVNNLLKEHFGLPRLLGCKFFADAPYNANGSTTGKGKKEDCKVADDCRPKDNSKELTKDIVKVCVCGSTTEVGRPMSLFLKKSKYINELILFDKSETCCALGIELAYMNLKCKIKSFCSPHLLKKALENCHIVVITTPSSPKGDMVGNRQCTGPPSDEEFKSNAKMVQDIIEASLDACPNAIIAIMSNPVSSMVPLACEIMKKRQKFDNIKKILGVTALDSLRCQSMVSSMLNLPIENVTVPVVGGTTGETLVPLLSQTKPPHSFSKEEVASLTEGLRAAVTEVEKAGGSPTITTAYAAASFVETICRVLKGETGIKQCAFVSTPHWLALGYLACPVLLSKEGIEEVLYPPINEFEQCLLNKAEKELKEDIKRGMDFIRCDTKGDYLKAD